MVRIDHKFTVMWRHDSTKVMTSLRFFSGGDCHQDFVKKSLLHLYQNGSVLAISTENEGGYQTGKIFILSNYEKIFSLATCFSFYKCADG